MLAHSGCVRLLFVLGMAWLVAACGGEATRGAGEKPGSGQAGAPSSGSPLAGLKLDESFPWFVQEAGGPYEAAADDQDAALVHVTFTGKPLQASLSTHNHVAVVGLTSAVAFSAKAEPPVTVLVSVKATLDADYFAAKAEGRLWPVAPVKVGTEWQRFAVPLADMKPPETTEPSEPPAFTIVFIVDEPTGPVDLWLDDVTFR